MTAIPILAFLGTDDEGLVLANMTGYELPEEPTGLSPAAALAAVQAEKRATEWAEAKVFANRGEPVKLAPVKNLTAAGYPDGNPKTAMGMKKPDLSVVPASALLHLATAMMNGSEKYGPYNYRDDPVSARTYVAAGLRHLLSYLDGEDFSQDTVEAGKPVHHLAHVMACCAILLDTTEVGTLLDNRPNVPGKTGDMIERFNKTATLRAA